MAVGLCLVVGVLGLLRGQPWVLVVVTAISLMVAAVPESLPTVVVLSLALGASLMATHRADRAATPGRIDDRIGFGHRHRQDGNPRRGPDGRATAVDSRRDGGCDVYGTGYEPDGAVRRDGGKVTVDDAADLVTLLRAAALCSDAKLDPPTPDQLSAEFEGLGDADRLDRHVGAQVRRSAGDRARCLLGWRG